MKNKLLYQKEEEIVRVLGNSNDRILIINCKMKNMPYWINKENLQEYQLCQEQNIRVLLKQEKEYELTGEEKKEAHKKFTMIAGILVFIMNEEMRNKAIECASKEYEVTKQTIRKYLSIYLIYQDINSLAPHTAKLVEKQLSQDEKNMRWALNKFFYTKNKNSLQTAYTLLLKNKYCEDGKLLQSYPSFYQFRYFYRKTKNMQSFFISRDGLKNYQRNHRPLLGDGVQEFATAPGVGMLDATICDIYLVNEAGQLVGRPILTACVDAYSGLCCGYTLSWEGGMYSLKNLMWNVLTDKKEHCNKFGIIIEDDVWPSCKMPGKLVTDMGSEYKSQNFEQLADLGVRIVNLPSYRPELKGPVEQFFDSIQEKFKPYLKGKGVIESDFQERGSHDYRRDACLTLKEFEKIILHCIIFYNAKRVIEFPYTEDMLQKEIKPYSNTIFDYGIKLESSNLIDVSLEEMIHVLLPRTIGRFTRHGLQVNKIFYHNDNFKEEYLQGKEVQVAYDPDDVGSIFLLDHGSFIKFSLIQSRYEGMNLSKVEEIKQKQRKLIKKETENCIQAKIDLAEHIDVISHKGNHETASRTNIKNIRQTRKKEQNRTHRDFLQEVSGNE